MLFDIQLSRPSHLVRQVLQLPIVTQGIRVKLVDGRIVWSSPPNPLDRLRNTDVVCLELVETNAHKECSEEKSVIECSADAGHAPLGDVVCYYVSDGWLAGKVEEGG